LPDLREIAEDNQRYQRFFRPADHEFIGISAQEIAEIVQAMFRSRFDA